MKVDDYGQTIPTLAEMIRIIEKAFIDIISDECIDVISIIKKAWRIVHDKEDISLLSLLLICR